MENNKSGFLPKLIFVVGIVVLVLVLILAHNEYKTEKVDNSDKYRTELATLTLEYNDKYITREQVSSNLDSLEELMNKVEADKDSISEYETVKSAVGEQINLDKRYFIDGYEETYNNILNDYENGEYQYEETINKLEDFLNVVESEKMNNNYWQSDEDYNEFVKKVSVKINNIRSSNNINHGME